MNECLVKRLEKKLTYCTLCNRRCGVNRLKGERGFCGLDAEVYVYNKFIHLGMERALIPAYTLVVGGCNLRCVFCSEKKLWTNHANNYNLFELINGIQLKEMKLNKIKSICFVGGEPIVNLYGIAKSLANLNLQKNKQIVFDTNLYTSVEVLYLLIESDTKLVYIADFKFGNNRCAKQLSGVNDYIETLTTNLSLLYAQMKNKQCNLIVRHLLLPGHFTCCFLPIVKWISQNIPETQISLFFNYEPIYYDDVQHKELFRRITEKEKEKAIEIMEFFSVNYEIPEFESLPTLRKSKKTESLKDASVQKKSKLIDRMPEETEIIIQPDGKIGFRSFSENINELTKTLKL